MGCPHLCGIPIPIFFELKSDSASSVFCRWDGDWNQRCGIPNLLKRGRCWNQQSGGKLHTQLRWGSVHPIKIVNCAMQQKIGLQSGVRLVWLIVRLYVNHTHHISFPIKSLLRRREMRTSSLYVLPSRVLRPRKCHLNRPLRGTRRKRSSACLHSPSRRKRRRKSSRDSATHLQLMSLA